MPSALQEAFRLPSALSVKPTARPRSPQSPGIGLVMYESVLLACPVKRLRFAWLIPMVAMLNPAKWVRSAFKAPHLMIGYWQDPDATAAVVRNGWLHTGDLASCDADGFYWFAGRIKEIIIRGGSNISPRRSNLSSTNIPR